MRENRTHIQYSALRWLIFLLGLLVMAFGIVLMIKADIGSAPWDVFHIGLYKQFGLTIGTWSIFVGFLLLFVTSLLTRVWPQLGAFLNMLLLGVFIDLFMLLPFLETPNNVTSKVLMLIIGIVINGYGIALYISAKCGAGPRDTLMLVLTKITGWKVQHIRLLMETIVLSFGYLLDGPVFVGTIIFSLTIGPILGVTLPQCEKMVDRLFKTNYIPKKFTSEM